MAISVAAKTDDKQGNRYMNRCPDSDHIALVFHGFGGSVREVAPLVAHLKAHGLRCHVVRLAGHDKRGRVQRGFGHREFLAQACATYRQLERSYSHIHLIGFSMGGLLALQLAAEFNPESVICINTPVRFWNAKAICHWLVDDWKESKPYHLRRLLLSAIRQPLPANLECPRLVKLVLPSLLRVSCPCLIVQSLLDDTADYRSAKMLANRLVNAQVSMVYLENSWHQVCDSPDVEKLCVEAEGFIRKVKTAKKTGD